MNDRKKKEAENGRYSRVSRRMWNDQKFRALSAPKPNAQTLFVRLLTGPENTNIPGLFQAWAGGLADAIGWPRAAFNRCFRELIEAGLVRTDWKCGLVWIPKGVLHNPPSSPNVVASWRATAKELPECTLLEEAFAEILEFLTERGEDWENSWRLTERLTPRPAKIPRESRAIVRQRDHDSCRYCGIEVNWKDRRGPSGATYDHVDPAGDSSVENVVVSCRSCNSRKGFRLPAQASMVLLEPRSDLGQNLGFPRLIIKGPSGNQEQEQEQEQEVVRTKVGLAGSMASRFTSFERSTGTPPSPRKDPLCERLPFAKWFPSQQWLDWFREAGISQELQDTTLVQVRDKLTGFHDVEWWDMMILRFFESALRRGATTETKREAVLSP